VARVPKIPKNLHYCFGLSRFRDKPWSLVHYVCVKSAIERIKPERTFLYYAYEPSGPWWELTKPLLQAVKIDPPKEVFGRPVNHPAHRADVIRLQSLDKVGGIYLDVDVFVHRDFDDLLNHSFVIGEQGIGGEFGLGNAVLLAEPAAPFVKRWYAEYRSFRKEHWSEHSVTLPFKLAKQFPDEVTVLPHWAFLWPLPTPEHLTWIFEPGQPPLLPTAYANHLWETVAWDKYLENLTVRSLREQGGHFHDWARPLVTELPDDFGALSPVQRFNAEIRRATEKARKRAGRIKSSIRKIVSTSTDIQTP
jgi:hypothetical protein